MKNLLCKECDRKIEFIKEICFCNHCEMAYDYHNGENLKQYYELVTSNIEEFIKKDGQKLYDICQRNINGEINENDKRLYENMIKYNESKSIINTVLDNNGSFSSKVISKEIYKIRNLYNAIECEKRK